MAFKEVLITVPMRTLFDPATGKGIMHLGATSLTVSDNDGAKIGTICSVVGVGLDIYAGEGPEDVWHLDPRDVWNGLISALERAQRLAEKETHR